MSSIQKKICMLGAFGVGKTSLVGRFVHQRFSDKYLTTLGVKVDKKEIEIDERRLTMILWDIAGEDDLSSIRPSYLRGLAGYLLVVDSTRGKTLDVALQIHDRVTREHGATVAVVLVVNKIDLADDWDLEDDTLTALEKLGIDVVRTSAKTDEGVREAFAILARQLLESDSA